MTPVVAVQHMRTILVLLFLSLATFFAFGTEPFRVEAVVRAVQQLYGASAGTAVRDWANALLVFRSGSDTQKLKDINDFFNRRIRFVDDQANWNQNDYWATPAEMLNRGAGDCEDYAIAKYYSLKFIGVPASKMRITYVKARIGGPSSTITQAHMVLTYYSSPDAEPLVLDNLVGEIRTASRRADLQPIFSFNTDGVWAAGSNEAQPGGGSSLSRWNELQKKMQAEGFD